MARAKAAPKPPTPCPVSKEEFGEHAQDLMVQIGDHKLIASKKEFSTGSFGWFGGDKVIVTVNGKPVRAQVGLNITVVGSKPTA